MSPDGVGDGHRHDPGESFAKFQTGWYAETMDAVFKALGVD